MKRCGSCARRSSIRVRTPSNSALALYLVLSLLVFGDKLILGEYGLIRISDTFDTNFVEFKIIGDLLVNHGLYGWYPHLSAGRPSHAFHVTPLYPLALVATVLPLWLLYAGLKILLMFVAGYGMFRFSRDYLDFEPRLALVSGAVFAFNTQTQGTTIVHTVFNFAFPLAFVWSLGLAGRGPSAWVTAGAGLLGLSVLSYPVLTGPPFASIQLLLILFLNPRHGGSRARLLARFATFWLGYALTFLPLVYALLDFKDESQRTYFPGVQGLLPTLVRQGSEALAGSLLVFPVGGALALLYHAPRVRRAAALTAVALLVSAFFGATVGNPLRETFVGKLELHLFFYVHHVLVSVLALVGLQFLLARRELLPLYTVGGVAALAVTAGPLYRAGGYGTVLWLHVLVPVAVYLSLRYLSVVETPTEPARPRWLLIAALVLLVVGVRVHVFHWGQENVAYRYYFADNPGLHGAFAGPDLGRGVTLGFHPALVHRFGGETADGYSVLFSGRYRALWRAAVAGQLTDEAERRRFDWYFIEINPLNGQTLRDFTHRVHTAKFCPLPFEPGLRWHLPLLLASNVTVVASLRPVPELEAAAERVVPGRCFERREGLVTFNGLRRFFSPAPVWVYSLKDAFGRGYLVSRADVLASDQAVLEALGRRSAEEFRNVVLLSAEDGHAPTGERPGPSRIGSGRVALMAYGPDRLVFEVEASAPSYLVVSNAYSRHWTASVDGHRQPLLRANHAFQAVRIDTPGRHGVVLEYRDRLLWWSYAALPIGVALIALVARPLGPPAAGVKDFDGRSDQA